MQRIIIDKDIIPLSEFRAKVTSVVQQVQRSKRPVVITHYGKSAAVLMDVGEYEALMRRIELLEDVQAGEAQIDSGKGISHRKAREAVLEKITR